MTRTKIMGILNVTPDSFYDGGRFFDPAAAVNHALEMCEAGADILDIGGESSRPGSSPVSLEEELERVIPVVEALQGKISVPISIDTMKPEVAAKAVELGARLINDVSGFRDPAMREVAASTGADVCVMHMLGSPKIMQHNPHYENGVVDTIIAWLETQIEELLDAGVTERQIIVDPGIGFGKTVADNLEIIHNLQKFKAMGFSVLLGISRKTFMSKILDKPYSETLPATLVINALAMQASVDIIRVHDVGEHRRVLNLIG